MTFCVFVSQENIYDCNMAYLQVVFNGCHGQQTSVLTSICVAVTLCSILVTLTIYCFFFYLCRCITIRYTAPKDVVIFNVDKARPIAEKILDLLLDYSLEENPVFFHVFSNGGGVIYRFISDALQDSTRPYSQIQIHGCMFDSLPGKRRIHKAAQAFISNIKANIFIRYAIGLCLMIYLFVMRMYLAIFSRGKKWDQFSYFQGMKEDKLFCPQLFLYSTGDKLVPHTDITEIIEFRRSLGVNVQSVQWDDSDHVAHLRKHREAYINACHQFVDDCIKLHQHI